MRLAMVLLLLLLAPHLAAQEVVSCKACSNHGSVECARHGKAPSPEQAATVRRCSVAAECKACFGVLAVDCKTCGNAAVEEALRERQRLVREWLQARRAAVDESVKRPLLHLETAHCDLVFSIRPTTVGREKLDTHALMHLYGERIEALRAMFCRVFEVPDADLPGRLEVYMFRDAQDQGVIGPRETGFGSAGSIGLKQMGPRFVYSMWHDLRSLPDDEALHRNIVHNVAHLLLSQMLPVQWIGNKSHGWIDEGVAHWFEDQVTGRCANFCHEEVLVHPGTGWKGGRWRTPVRKMVDEGGLPAFAALSSRNTDQLTFEEHAASFALVDFLITVRGGASFRDLVRHAKRGRPMREALAEVHGWSPISIDAPFHQWVRENYPATEAR
jgi:hypothetical protein